MIEQHVTLTVLYVHGLESGPHGRKARYLADAGFAVVSDQMPCSRAQIARDPLVIAAASAAIAFVAGSTVRAGLLGLTAAVCAGAAASPLARAGLMRRVMQRSVAVQTRALAAHSIDVVVGSSFGGAVALDLLLRGAWPGPTLLLCPAHRLVAHRARLRMPPALASLPDAVSSRVLVVHGRGDETVPVADSQQLVAGSRARLVLVDDDHRLSTTATPERFTEWIAMTGADANAR